MILMKLPQMVIDLATHMDERFEAFELWVDRRFEEADQKVYRLFSESTNVLISSKTKLIYSMHK